MSHLFPPEEGPAGYCWIIDKDHLVIEPGDRDDAGTIGPRNATDEMIAQLVTGAGREFRMYDDDGELYYTGRILGLADDDSIFWVDDAAFGPLWDFGLPNAGAVSIHYKNQAGAWQTL